MSYSWGQLPIQGPTRTLEGNWRFETLAGTTHGDSLLPYGKGRSYGDSCINSNANHISTSALNKFISFDSVNGILECEAGITLSEILQIIVPRGWFLPVVPGTRYITLGGAIANDVHGKNHHSAGSFGCHVHSLTLLRSDGARPRCSPGENPELFGATIGGLGLTGLITHASVGLIPIDSNQLTTQDIAFSSLAEFAALSKESLDWEYTVAWIDTVGIAGRGIFSRARHTGTTSDSSTKSTGIHPTVPFTPPFSLVGRSTVKLFNEAFYFLKKRKQNPITTHYDPFFFPLDSISNWNRIYGKAGFYQYQCVLPLEEGLGAVQQLLENIQSSGEGSFLAVLKEFGDRLSPGLLSFPRPGLTLALDFPNRGDKTRQLMDKLDQTVMNAGGALYPAKDARMSAELFRSGFPKVEEFEGHIDPYFSSSFWRRVQG